MKKRAHCRWGWPWILMGATLSAVGQSDRGDKSKQEPPDPALSQRPSQVPQSSSIREGKIKLDVVVVDAAGKPVVGLEPWEFKILDNGQTRKVVSFRRFDNAQGK